MLTTGFVQVMVQIGTCRNEAVESPFVDQVGYRESEATRSECSGHSEENQHIVGNHSFPDAPCGGEISALE